MKGKLTVLNCLVSNGPEFATVDTCSLEMHRHAALLVLLELSTWTSAREDESK